MDDETALVIVEGASGLADLPDDVEGIEAKGFTDADVASLAARPALERLDLAGSPEITDQGLRDLRGASRLRMIGLNGLESITDAGLAALAEIPTLEEVYPCGCRQLGDGALEALSRLPRLRDLYITGAGFTDAGMAHVASCPSLEVLGMDGPVGDAGDGLLAGHPRIRELHLPACRLLTVEGLAALVTMPALEVLAFYGTPQADDSWLDVLGAAARPRKLVLIGCPGVTEEGLRRLAERRPDLVVEMPGAGS